MIADELERMAQIKQKIDQKAANAGIDAKDFLRNDAGYRLLNNLHGAEYRFLYLKYMACIKENSEQ